jgi:hypothetical protein
MKDQNGSKAEGLHKSINEPPGQGTPHGERRSQRPGAIPAAVGRWVGEGRHFRSWQPFLTGLLRGLSLPVT